MRGLGPALLLIVALPACAAGRHPVPRAHPRLFGGTARLRELARQRPEAWRRTLLVAREADAGPWEKTVSLALARVIEGDAALGRAAVEQALKLVRGPIRVGHETFGHDLALVAVAFDLCHDEWTDAERAAAIDYLNRTIEANRDSETHVFHNGWYGYKQWGIGAACYATFHENPRAPAALEALLADWRERAAPALELAGAGGGWAEGYYLHYFLYEWLVFCEMARFCEGLDLLADAPSFFGQRAVASAFEMYPGLREYGSRRPIPMGDGGGQLFGGDRDKALFARCILASRFRDDPLHQAVAAFDASTPRSSVGNYAYKDFLWRDETVPRSDLNALPRSHLSPGPGYVYARSDWSESATHFFFKCGDRFTAHQHLDVNHFLIARGEPLLGDGGHYDDFASRHAVNYYLRSVAHNTLLVLDPAETWPAIRGAATPGNDGGQHHDWPHHNGAVVDPQQWARDRRLYDIADLLAFQDAGAFVYVVGDGTRAYRPAKLRRFVRRILYVRPSTFIVVDETEATDPAFAKTLCFQTIGVPAASPPWIVAANGPAKLFVQSLLPAKASVRLVSGAELYQYNGQAFPPGREVGPAPAGRIEIRPSDPAARDWFVTVLTAADATLEAVPLARVSESEAAITVQVGEVTATFQTAGLGGSVTTGQGRVELATAMP